jgi:UDP-2,3-diacylglucosamine hydrolase
VSRRLAPYCAGAAPLPMAAERVTLFTDLHLHAARPQEIAAFLIQLRESAASGGGPTASERAVIVMGDLFDAYAGPEDWRLPGFDAMRDAIGEVTRSGIRVVLLRGNRDVALEPADAAPCGAQVADGVIVRLGVRPPALITHGDAFCLADRRYQFLRRTLRRPGLRRFLRARGAGTRRWLAARLRGVSRGEMARKPLADLEILPDPLRAELRQHGAQQAVLGHLHQERRLDLGAGLRARVLPAWDPETSPWDLAALLDGRA